MMTFTPDLYFPFYSVSCYHFIFWVTKGYSVNGPFTTLTGLLLHGSSLTQWDFLLSTLVIKSHSLGIVIWNFPSLKSLNSNLIIVLPLDLLSFPQFVLDLFRTCSLWSVLSPSSYSFLTHLCTFFFIYFRVFGNCYKFLPTLAFTSFIYPLWQKCSPEPKFLPNVARDDNESV